VKGEWPRKKPFNFALFWDKYGTFFILAIIVAIFGTLSSEYFLTTNNITQIFVQSSVTVLIGMGSSSLSWSRASTCPWGRFWRSPAW
jgi:D-allose transport system permease protein